MANGRGVYCRSSMVLVGFLTLMVGNCLVSSMALAGEFRLMVHDVKGDADNGRSLMLPHLDTDCLPLVVFPLDRLVFTSARSPYNRICRSTTCVLTT